MNACAGPYHPLENLETRPPHTTPVWYGYKPGGSITFFTGTQGRKSRKAGFIEMAGVLSLRRVPRDSPRRSSLIQDQGLCSLRSDQTAG